jgi:sporulation protein YtfJ
MSDHPIEALMDTAMENIKGMVDVNTIVGDPVETANGSVIVPISKVSFGFAAGGSEYTVSSSEGKDNGQQKDQKKPFGGGSGAGVMLQPVAFLVVGEEQVRLLPVTNNAVIERLINVAPELMQEIKSIMKNDSKNGAN